MKKESFFASEIRDEWPAPREIERYFLGPPEQRWLAKIINPSASFTLAGLSNTEHLPWYDGRIDVEFALEVHPKWGVFLEWSKRGGDDNQAHFAKGDLSLLGEYCYVGQTGPLPVGLFVPLSRSVRPHPMGVRSRSAAPYDLPPGTFPESAG